MFQQGRPIKQLRSRHPYSYLTEQGLIREEKSLEQFSRKKDQGLDDIRSYNSLRQHNAA